MYESMVIYRSFYEAIKDLENSVKGEIYDAIIGYGLNGIEPDLEGVAKSIFTLVKPQIDANNRRKENGAKGGRNRTEEEPNKNLTGTKTEPKPNLNRTKTEPKPNQTETEAEPNVNVKVNVNAKVNENVNANVVNNNKAARSTFSEDKQLDAAIRDFTEHRRKLRKPMTDKAVKLFMARLEKICPKNIPGQVELINTAIERGWQTVYPPNGTETIKSPESDSKLDALADTWLEKVGGD